MNLDYTYLSEEGIKTPVNQDYYVVPDKNRDTSTKGWLFAISDGVAGYLGGNVASKICCRTLIDDYYNQDSIFDIPHWLNDEIIKINKTVLEMGKEDPLLHGMATTLVSLLIKDGIAYINNVGDSRIYLFANDSLKQLTEDHSVVWEYYIRRVITKDEIIDSNIKHLITEAIGLNYYPRINSYTVPLPDEFTFLLCSDGLTDVVTDSKLEQVIRSNPDLKTCVTNLHQLALGNSSRDDVTIIMVKNTN